jgi:hypothetical protein
MRKPKLVILLQLLDEWIHDPESDHDDVTVASTLYGYVEYRIDNHTDPRPVPPDGDDASF